LLTPNSNLIHKALVFYDGDCSLCNGSVRFLQKHNSSGNLSYVSLQSETGKNLLSPYGAKGLRMDSLLLLENNNLFNYSSAAIKIATHLDYPWRLAMVLIIIPKPLRDSLYKFIAKKRNSWFKTKNHTCANSEFSKKVIVK